MRLDAVADAASLCSAAHTAVGSEQSFAMFLCHFLQMWLQHVELFDDACQKCPGLLWVNIGLCTGVQQRLDRRLIGEPFRVLGSAHEG